MQYPPAKKPRRATGKAKLKTPESVNGMVKAICDIMRRSNCAGALQYVPELTWILFLRILDEREAHEAEEDHKGQVFNIFPLARALHSVAAGTRAQTPASPSPPAATSLP